jgi:hypothetical protein
LINYHPLDKLISSLSLLEAIKFSLLEMHLGVEYIK